MASSEEFHDELSDYYDFLASHLPFSDLPPSALRALVHRLSIRYDRAGTEMFGIGDPVESLFIVRKGAVEVFDTQGNLIAQEAEGECFGFPALLGDGKAARRVLCAEDTLAFCLPAPWFHEAMKDHLSFAQFFNLAHELRLRSAVADDNLGLLRHSAASMVRRKPIFIEATKSVQEAAERMAREGISCILVRPEPTEPSRLVGILTDQDLRSRVLARGLDGQVQVSEVMTPKPTTVEAGQPALEVLLSMTRYRIRHVPVVERGDVVGVLSATDLLQSQAAHPVYLVGELQKHTSYDGLVETARRLPSLVQRLSKSGVRSGEVASVVTMVADALTERFIVLAEQELGPPPCKYAWVGLGSQARSEMGIHSDQDNALILEQDGVDDAYFERLAVSVRDGLVACGFPSCPGDVMATHAKWRQPRSVWASYFARWIEQPEPKALMHASVFFDMRTIVGEGSLVDGLLSSVVEQTPRNQRFLACLARNALSFRPPLGFFRQFVLERRGEQGKALDLKTRAIGPVVAIARLHALAQGSPCIGTRERIQDVVSRGGLGKGDGDSLLDAFEFISNVRLEHQTVQAESGQDVDNYVAPDSLSRFEREHLKDAFSIIETMQSNLEYRYKTGMLG